MNPAAWMSQGAGPWRPPLAPIRPGSLDSNGHPPAAVVCTNQFSSSPRPVRGLIRILPSETRLSPLFALSTVFRVSFLLSSRGAGVPPASFSTTPFSPILHDFIPAASRCLSFCHCRSRTRLLVPLERRRRDRQRDRIPLPRCRRRIGEQVISDSIPVVRRHLA